MRQQDLVRWLLLSLLLIIVNALAVYLPGRIDLTEEKRYTLTPASAKILREFEDPVFIEVLLAGQFPANFARFQQSIEELLRDFEDVNGRIEFSFSDPNAGTLEEANANRKLLAEQGLHPVNFQVVDASGKNDRPIYPYAIINYQNRRGVVNLLENTKPGQSPDVALNNSVSLLEYKLVNALQKLRVAKKPLIAFTSGNGELSELQTRDLTNTLAPYYQTARLNLDTMGTLSPQLVGAVIVARPQTAFSDREKFILDQYIMKGGRVMWLLDKLRINLDSLQRSPTFVPPDYQLNLDDLLFKYGLRLEANLVLDLQSSRIPIVVGQVGNAPQFDLRPWPYHVLATPNNRHPVTRSLGPVDLYFPSEIDTGITTRLPLRRTALLTSSGKSLLQYSPVRVSLEGARYELDPARFTKKNVPLAVLAEGKFSSLFANRLSSEFESGLKAIGETFSPESVPTKMLLVADGDIAKNQIDPVQKAFKPLGLNPFERYVFDNKAFLINAIEYFFDDQGILSARNREVKLRPLDTGRIRSEEGFWRALNIGLPLVLLTLFGILYGYIRQRRFARP